MKNWNYCIRMQYRQYQIVNLNRIIIFLETNQHPVCWIFALHIIIRRAKISWRLNGLYLLYVFYGDKKWQLQGLSMCLTYSVQKIKGNLSCYLQKSETLCYLKSTDLLVHNQKTDSHCAKVLLNRMVLKCRPSVVFELDNNRACT